MNEHETQEITVDSLGIANCLIFIFFILSLFGMESYYENQFEYVALILFLSGIILSSIKIVIDIKTIKKANKSYFNLFKKLSIYIFLAYILIIMVTIIFIYYIMFW